MTRVHGFYRFVETVLGNPNSSRTLLEFFNRSRFNRPETNALLERLRAIHRSMEVSYDIDGFPSDRHVGKSVDQIFLIRSAFAKDLNDFSQQTLGLLPIAVHSRYFKLLRQLEPVYDELIWKSSEAKLKSFKDKLEAKSAQWRLAALFSAAVKFYGAEWPTDQPFIIALTPIPGQTGHTSAESLESLESVGVLVDSNDIAGEFGVIFHELCHSLYAAQPLEMQNLIGESFLNSQSQHAPHAYRLINEVWATILGNGWAASQAVGKMDQGRWYNDAYIDGFAHALYPAVMDYVKAGRPIDRALVEKAVAVFAAKFPQAPFEVENLMGRVHIISDGVVIRSKLVAQTAEKYFRMQSVQLSAPVNHPSTLDELKKRNANILIVVSEAQIKQFTDMIVYDQFLLDHAAEFKEKLGEYIFAGVTAKGRGYLVVRVNGVASVERAMKWIKSKKVLDVTPQFYDF